MGGGHTVGASPHLRPMMSTACYLQITCLRAEPTRPSLCGCNFDEESSQWCCFVSCLHVQAHKRLTEAREAGPTAGEQMDLLATAQHASLWARMVGSRLADLIRGAIGAANREAG